MIGSRKKFVFGSADSFFVAGTFSLVLLQPTSSEAKPALAPRANFAVNEIGTNNDEDMLANVFAFSQVSMLSESSGAVAHAAGTGEPAEQSELGTDSIETIDPNSMMGNSDAGSSSSNDAEEFAVTLDDLSYATKQASIKLKRREFKACIQVCDRILKVDEDNYTAMGLKGRALVALKKYEEAAEILNKVISADLAKHAVYGAHAIAMLQLEKYQNAIDDCSKAIALSPKNQEYFIVRAVAEHRLKDIKHAMDDINKGMSLDPEGPNLPLFLLARSEILLELNRDDDCLKDLNKLVKLRPQDPQSYMSRASFYAKKADWTKAIHDLDSVIDYALMGPLSNQALILRAQAQRKIDNFVEVETDYSSLLAGYPRDVDYLYGRAEARYRLQKFERALKDINAAIDVNQLQPRLYELRALIYEALNMKDKAAQDREKASALSTKNS